MAPRTAPRVLALTLAGLAGTQLLLEVRQVFVGSTLPVVAPRPIQARAVLRAEETEGEGEAAEEEARPPPEWHWKTMPDRGLDLDGDKLDNLDDWYKEGILGKGGAPTGFMRDLVLRSFFGSWNEKKYFKRSRDYTGPNRTPCQTDYDTAFEKMKSVAKEGELFIGKNDNSGLLWLTATQNPGGIELYFAKSPPFGERPLAIIKQDNVDEFFAKVDWNRLFVRLHKWQLWGGSAQKFPYPVAAEKMGFNR
jgi:hypothetical protein|mmetsp:Transcript_48611/g.105916  ORF Transcript_48611/g.105916 Transcript_48611/m.105916 type:complete len:250 (+) Transcript_48611:77-826(+)